MPHMDSNALSCVPQAVASNSMLHHDRTAWLADAAPEPRDVIWSNLGWASRWLPDLTVHTCTLMRPCNARGHCQLWAQGTESKQM